MKKTNIIALISTVLLLNACSQENTAPYEFDSITQPIVGGQIVEDYKHTSTVKISSLDGQQQYKCSGTLISDNYILTAAHCIVKCDMSELTLQSAHVAQVSNQVFWHKFLIESAIISPDYSCTYNEESGGYYMSHDIGIIKLKESVPSSVGHPSPLLPHELIPSVNDIESGSVNLLAIGMGNSQFDVSETFPVKRQTELPLTAYCSNGTGPRTSKCHKSRVS
ncbi:MAG: trypsin-like serine protease, partial [Proteobacteria bacterium]|nr:trypsin-like serine protease [Pseudomonadota bacterium]